MKIKIFLAVILMGVCAMSASAQTNKKAKNRHAEAQKELLANQNKNSIDKNTIANLIQRDVAARENVIPGLSPESAAMIEDLLHEAQKHIGKKYVWGSKGPNTFDCSGFTSYVYRQFGYNITPASKGQYLLGEGVKRNQLRKGDLVFFTSPRSGSGVGHVGIVWSADNETGNFKFIHASVKGVKISDFEGYYVKRYIGARRLINN